MIAWFQENVLIHVLSATHVLVVKPDLLVAAEYVDLLSVREIRKSSGLINCLKDSGGNKERIFASDELLGQLK